MARRSNRRKRGHDSSEVAEKHKIAKLIESQASKKRKSPHTSEDTTGLREQYGTLLSRFSNLADQPLDDASGLVATVELQIPNGEADGETKEDENAPVDEKQQDHKISKRQLRKMAKPSLSELKKTALYPEVIEWYDCDAQYPALLVNIKSSKNIVQVPAHWQTKREYLSGRSLLEKKPFELPDIIKQTDIEVMRKTIPEDENGKEDPSLKQTSRARVQPKLGSLDIDYKKLHDVFFKLGARWKPDILLAYGDQYYENRNLHEEAVWKKYRDQKKPGKISSKLRQAMGLSEGQLPPWCAKMRTLGMPPSYPDLKIAGLNWDIENLRGEVYGSLKDPDATKNTHPLFGTIISAYDEPETTEESKTKRKEAQEHTVEQALEPVKTIIVDDGKQVTQTTKVSPPAGSPVPQESPKASKALYTVLKEKAVEETARRQGVAYVIHDVVKQDDNRTQTEVSEQIEDQIDTKFKF
ncbi:hypothetical protein HG536_0H01200 [Torulaspora globosa]|uniref:PSP proline-rich domain-containing protein n=1 Tax=Torulaspora globosa TaxID=48254 RepID=A0A7G3ZMK9_9SACH|nr:uncharacterized protein HG536_0H01200 [Torulaspora globosa]QLL34745.1 hypothetical protein HG536_0H01200 [Torulaspora globosa]